MKQMKSSIVVKQHTKCPKCGHYQYKGGKWCEECGNSMEFRAQVMACPFCGDEFTASHDVASCAYAHNVVTHIYQGEYGDISLPTSIIMRDDDTDLWLYDRWMNYDSPEGSLKPLTNGAAMALIVAEIQMHQEMLERLLIAQQAI